MQRSVAAQYARQDFLSGLNQSLSPARLLSFEGGHLNRQFCRAFDVLQIDKPPALELGAIGKIGVFGERVVLPAAGFIDRRPPPNSGSSVEIKEDSTARAARVFQHEVTVKQDGFDLREERIVAIDMRPARLHHANLRVSKVMDGAK